MWPLPQRTTASKDYQEAADRPVVGSTTEIQLDAVILVAGGTLVIPNAMTGEA